MRTIPLRLKRRKISLTAGLLGFFAACSSLQVAHSSDRKVGKPALHEVRLEKLSKSILALDIADGSDLAAVALSDLRVRVWRLGSGQVVHEFSFPEPETDLRLRLDDDVEPISLRFSPEGKTLAVGFLNAIHLYDVENWLEKMSLGVAGEDKLRPDIKVTPARPELERRTAEEVQAQKNKPAPTLNEATRAEFERRVRGDGRTRIISFEFARGGSFILAAYCRGHCHASTFLGRQWLFPTGNDPVRLWDVHSARILWERLYDPKGVVSRIVVSSDGNRFAAFNSELGHCAVGVYDLSDGRTLSSQPLGPCADAPDVRFLQDGQSFITNRIDEGNRKNKLWNEAAIYETSTGRKIADLSNRYGVGKTDISSDGRWLVSTTSRGGQFQIWDLQAKKTVITKLVKDKGWSIHLDRVRLSPDGRWLIVGNNIIGDLAIYQFTDH